VEEKWTYSNAVEVEMLCEKTNKNIFSLLHYTCYKLLEKDEDDSEFLNEIA